MHSKKLETWKYSVVAIEFPFSDQAGKKVRPALCLVEPVGKYHEVVVAFITSKLPFDSLDTDLTLTKDLTGFDQAGLPHASTIRLHKLATINAENISQAFGRLPDNLHPVVESKLRHFFATKTSQEP